MWQVRRFINRPVTSNCFIAWPRGSSDCIVIDPGSAGSDEQIDWLDRQGLNPKYILLTHHHFDHIAGVVGLKERYSAVRVVCNQECAALVVDRKKNCSLYQDGTGFELPPPDMVFDQKSLLMIDDQQVVLYNAPGHSTSSILIEIGSRLFTGDTLIKETKTVVKLPTSSKEALHTTIHRMYLRYHTGTWIAHAGHGPSFPLNGYDFTKAL